jgi:hypothetical protein
MEITASKRAQTVDAIGSALPPTPMESPNLSDRVCINPVVEVLVGQGLRLHWALVNRAELARRNPFGRLSAAQVAVPRA